MLSLAFLALLTMGASDGSPPRPSVPLLVLSTTGCTCPATVTTAWAVGAGSTCMLNGVAQPCFTITADPATTDAQKDGQCYKQAPVPGPGQPQLPDPCPLSDVKECSFPGYKVKIAVAPCAGTGSNPNANCGPVPYVVSDPFGQDVTKKLLAGGTQEVIFNIAELECRKIRVYSVEVKASSGVVVAQYNVTATCGKCDLDPNPFP